MAPMQQELAMCRSIQQLRRTDGPAPDDEIRAAALQFVRKVSGYRTPSRANEPAFEQAVADVTEATRRMLQVLSSETPRSKGSNQ